MLNSERGEKLWQYWQQQLAGELPILNLPTDRPRPAVPTYEIASYSVQVNPEILQRLHELAVAETTKIYTIFLATFFVQLYRYSGQEDILVVTPISGRTRTEFEEAIGHLDNNLDNLVVIRGNLAKHPTFKAFLAQVHGTVTAAREHLDYPFALLVEKLQAQRDTSDSPIFQVAFNWDKIPEYERGEELQLEPYIIEGDFPGAAVDLNLQILEKDGGIEAVWQYNTHLFDESTIARMAGHFQKLLESIVATPQKLVAKLPLLTEKERHQLLESNNTAVDYPQDKCIHQLFEEQVEKTPDAVAVVFEGKELTYRELNSRANQLAHYLQKLGVKPESLVGICVERSLEMIVGLLGILKAGGAYVPIDPSYPSDRIAYMLKNSQASVLLTQKKLVAGFPENQAQIICLDADWNLVSQQSDLNPNCTASQKNLAYVIYTSGSTGKPKGVAMKHLALRNLILWQRSNTTVSTRAKTLQFAPISFDVSFQEIFSTWCGGGTLVLISEDLRRDPVALLHLLRAKQVERLFLPFVALQQLAETAQSFGLIPTSLREVITAGEKLQITRAIASFFSQLKDCSLHNHYGPSESHVVTAFTLTGSTENWSALPPIGRPIANTQIYILDRFAQPVPVGIPGELYIGGVSLARGYLNRPELTEQKFIPNPFNNKPGSRLYETGDLARYLPDGNIEFLGRTDNQVKLRGFRIEEGEIEVTLAQHPDLRQTAVIVREDQPGDKRLVAYVCPNEGQIPTSVQLRRFLQEKLPDYMVPGTFIILEAFPLTPSGKVDRRALPAPDISSLVNQTSFVAPRDSVEQEIAEIWSEVLGVSPIGVHDNFIDLGGHSLLATKIMGLVRSRLQLELPLNRLFECPTVAELAKIVTQVSQEERSHQQPPLEPISRHQSIPLSFPQEQLWFLSQLAPSEPIYNETFAIHLGGNIDIPALSDSLTELIRRHEILRTTFGVVNGQPIQEIHPSSTFTLPVVDLRSLQETERETEALRIATEQLRTAFDLTQGSLLRATLIQLTEIDYRLYFAVHHILVDGESLTRIFLPELETIYTAFYQGLPSPLPELTIQYADFAVWQRKWLQGDIISHQLAYWEKQLENLPQLQLPTDRPHSRETTFAGSRLGFELSKELTEKLKTIGRKEGVTLFMTLGTAINILLYRYSSQEDIALGTVTSQRNRPELQGVMGDFLNTLVLRSDLSGNPSFRELLKRVKNVILSAYANQDVPFETVIAAVHPDRSLGKNPLFQVMFVLQPPLTDDKLGWKVSQFEIDSGSSKFNLTFNLEERPEGIIGAIEYNTDLFDAATIERAIGHLMTLLEGIVANPQTSIAQLPLLTEKDRYQLLVEWNNTAVDYPQDKCIHQLFEEQVERTPDAVAVVFEGKELTYRELNDRANQLAHYLQTLGVGPEVRVGIYLDRSPHMIVAVMGAMKAGGCYIPLDPNWPIARMERILSSQGVGYLVTQQKYLRIVREQQWKQPQLTHGICLDVETVKPPPEKLDRHATRSLWDWVAQQASDRVTAGGFISSYTGQPFSETEVDEYKNHVVKLAQPYLGQGKRVLEIGCGSGEIMFAIAPRVELYLGLDPSEITQARNREALAQSKRVNIKLLTGFADEINSIEDGPFGLIILASTVQFFPGTLYLQQAIEDAFALLAPGGAILLADIMDARRKEEFAQSCQGKSKTNLDSELYLDEDFFWDLPNQLESIAEISVLKRERGFENELRYRYDVILQKEGMQTVKKDQPLVESKKPLWTNWHLSQMSRQNLAPVASSDNTAYLIYTSGSTGVPKGVIVRHQSAVNLIDWVNKTFQVGECDRLLFVTSLCFDLSVYDIFGILAAGGSIHLASSDELKKPHKLVELLCNEPITFWDSAPPALQRLVSFFPSATQTHSSLRLVFLSGDWIPVTLPDTLKATFPKTQVIGLGGATEATIWSNYYPINTVEPNWASIPYGKPIQNALYHVLDSALNPCPIGVAGVLYIGGTCLAFGYDDPEKTAEKFIRDPFSDRSDARLYNTGDLARYLPDGNIEFLGRIDDRVKIRGFRIELGEIEAVFAQHPDVQEVVVIAREDIPGDKRLVAYFITDGEKPAIDDLRAFLKTKLPDYMIPSAFVLLEAIPLTANGKVDREALRMQYRRALPAPDISSLANQTSFVAPRDSVEWEIAEIWSEVLGVSPIGVHDNFIDLGGHSLLATKIIGLVRDRLQVELPLNRLFESPTVAELATIFTQVSQEERSHQQPPLEPISRHQTIPLSFSQKQLWFLTQLAPSEPLYQETFTIYLSGNIDIPALSDSLTEIIRRNEILRTTFGVVNGQPIQEINPPFTFTLPVLNLRSCPETERETEALRIATEKLRQGFDLTQGPLLRATLIQLTKTDYRLYLAVHHIVVDGESMIGIFLPELETLYRAFSQGLPSPLPELALQYADFAVWQRKWLQGDIISHQLAYWEKQLENLPQLQLPTDRPHSPETTFAGSRLGFELSKELTEKLKTIGRQEGVTLFMTIATAINILLYRYSSQEDIAIGTVTSQRNRPELQGVMGDFLNTLVLRSDLSGNPSFRELLKRVRNVILSAYANQDVPFEQVVNALHPDRSLGQNPLFQVMFVLQPPLSDDNLGWTVSQLEVDSGSSKFNLALNLEERSQGIIGAIEYNSDLFDATTIERAIGHLMTLLEAMISDRDRSISEFPLLTEKERHQLLVKWNNTGTDYSQEKCIHQLFEEQVEKTPNAVAVVFEGQELTYRKLNQRANQLARYLQSLGVGSEVLVILCVERSVEMMVAMLGILKAGGAYVPIAPAAIEQRLAFICEDTQANLLLTQQSLLDAIAQIDLQVICLDAGWEQNSLNLETAPLCAVTVENTAYVIYTSGSTGKPKGVAISHRNLSPLLHWGYEHLGLTQGDRTIQYLSYYFDWSVWEIFITLTSGASLFIPSNEEALNFAKTIDFIEQNQITVVHCTPTQFQNFIADGRPLKTLKYACIGAEALSYALVERAHQLLPPDCRIFNMYGPTEATIISNVLEIDRLNIGLYQHLTTIPIGEPVANARCYVLNADNIPQPVGIPGELWISGDGVARGYLNRPELTAEKFVLNLDSDWLLGDRLYKTGDWVRWLSDGTLEFLGRLDHQVKIRGLRIELGEIEALLAQHPDVRDVLVLAREDNPGDKRLVAYVAGKVELTIRNLSDFLKSKLPNYMVPSAFVLLEAMPLTPNGKVDREALRMQYRRALPAPNISNLAHQTSFVAPRDSVELQLAEIWSEILGVSPIGVRDNFFDLGGHSLLAVRLIAEIEKEFGKNLSLAALFQGATVEQLAILLHQQTDTRSWSPLVPIQPQGEQAPFFWMPGSGGNVIHFQQLAYHLGNDQPFYALQPPSLDGVSEPFTRIEDIATYYLQAIQSVQPKGPYYLGGHSFGVFVAFEMARQLQKQGETVAVLALLDLPARLPGSPPKQLDWDDTRWLTNIAHILEMLSGKNLEISYESLKPLTPEAQLNHLKQQMEIVNLLPPNSGIDRVRGIVQTIKADELAFMSYLPRRGYQGRITLFRTSEVYQDELGMLGEIPTDLTWGWNQFSSQPVEVDVVPGNHTTMLGEPHVQVLAEKLKFCLARVC